MDSLFWSDCKCRFSFPIRLCLYHPTSILTFILSVLFPIPSCDVSFVGLSCLTDFTHSFPNSRKWQDIYRTMWNSELISFSAFLVRQAIFFLLHWVYVDPWGIFYILFSPAYPVEEKEREQLHGHLATDQGKLPQEITSLGPWRRFFKAVLL